MSIEEVIFPYGAYQALAISVTKVEAEEAVRTLLRYIGEDAARDGLVDTPRRVVSWLEEFRRNKLAPKITTFDGIQYNEMVLVKDISFSSVCEHHLLPFMGRVAVAYLPGEGGHVIGLSKLARLVVWCGRRLQVQERLTQEIHQAITDATGSTAVAVVVEAEHLCMAIRGVEKPGHLTTTSALSGAFKENLSTRSEFLGLLRSRT